MTRTRLRVAEEKAEDKHIDAKYYKYHLDRVSWLYDDLSRWESKIRDQLPSKNINECDERNKVKFAAATLQGRALTWWNSQVSTLGLENLRVKYSNIAAYTQRFNELILFCPDSVPNEKKKIKAYIRGLPKNVKGETTSSRPTTLNEAVRMAHALTEQKLQAKAERVTERNKRK
nr:hypothetical protein [Tanacetum cinerariifolium]